MSDTKQKILYISLSLFSQRGFSSVSIRDICKQVNIKESSVYYHFKNKQSILDEILFKFQQQAEDMMCKLEQALMDGTAMQKENFYKTVCDYFFEKYLMDEFCNKVMRLLLIEQAGNTEMQKIFDEWMFEKPLKFQKKVFSILSELNFIIKADPEYLSVKYYSPIYLFAQRWLLSTPLTEKNKQAFRHSAYGHIQKFFEELKMT